MKRSILAVATLSAICSLPLSAGEIDMNEHYSLKEIHTLVISQKELNPITIGINIVPISTSITTYPGNELLLAVKGSSFLGTARAPHVESSVQSGILSLDIGYHSTFKAGLRAGKIEIEIQIPDSFTGNVQLKEMKSPTEVEALSLESFSAFMRNSKLSLRELKAHRIELDSKGNGKIECSSVNAAQWRVDFGSGAFIAREITGQVELKNFDGKTDIAFSRFEGRSSFRSGGGNITISLPETSTLAMELVSKTKTADCEFNLVEENLRQKKGHKSGLVGAASDNYLSAQTRFGKVRVLSSPEGGR